MLFSLVSLSWFLDQASLGTRHASVHGVTRIRLSDSATTTTCLCTSLVRTGAPFLAVSHFSWMQSHWFSNPVVLGAHFSSARIQSWGARFGLEFVTPQGKGLRSFEVLWDPSHCGSWQLGCDPPPQVRSSLCLFHLPPCCPLTFYCGGSVFRSLFKGVIPYVVIDLLYPWDFPGGSDGKPSAYNAGDPVQSLDWEDLLKKEMATQSSSLAWKIPWWATVQGVTKSQTWLSDFTLILGRTCVRIFLSCRLGSSPIILHF